MAAATVDFIIDQGEDWSAQIYWTDFYNEPHNITRPMRMEIKSSLGAQVAELIAPEVEPPPGEIPSIAYSNYNGWIQLHIPDTITTTMPPGTYNYDLFVSIDDGDIYAGEQIVRLIAGHVRVNKRVTSSV